jgi:hypothetical protein
MAVSQPLIREAVAAFNDSETLQQAVADLQSHGFDRSEISFLARGGLDHQDDTRRAEDDPRAPRDAATTDADMRQARVLGTSLAAVLAGFAAAGFTVMTGGVVALAAGAAVLAAGGVGAAGALVGRAAGEEEKDFLQEQIDRGGVLLWVRIRDAEAERRALDILRRHSAHDVHVHDLPASAAT